MNFNTVEFYVGLDKMFKNGNYIETERYLIESKKNAEASGEIDAQIAVNNELGGYYRAIGKIDDAILIYAYVLDKIKCIGLEGSENHAAALINSGSVFSAAKQFDQAESQYLEAKHILQKLNLTSDYRMAALLNNISTVYAQKDNLILAEQSARSALDIITLLPNAFAELATTHISLGQIQIKQGKYEVANENLNKAIKIFEERTNGKDVHYAAAKAAQGELYFRLKDYENATKCYEQALFLTERDFGKTRYYELLVKNLENIKQSIDSSN